MSKLNISISAEPIFHAGPLTVTNTLLTSWLITAFLVIFAIYYSKRWRVRPTKFQLLLEAPFEYMYNLSHTIAEKKATDFFPFIMTFFLFILLSNWSGLIPGVGTIGLREGGKLIPLFRGPTADLNTTIALSVSSVVLIQYFGVKSLGKNYFKKFFNFKNPIYTFVGILELISEFSKLISFAFRLFGNIFAGEVLLTVISFLIPVLIPIPFYGLELFVGIIQAFVFSVLTLAFLNIATINHDEEH